jgi:hypothetical protein
VSGGVAEMMIKRIKTKIANFLTFWIVVSDHVVEVEWRIDGVSFVDLADNIPCHVSHGLLNCPNLARGPSHLPRIDQ